MSTTINSCEINKLPDKLLEGILTCVPIQDAVKTSILSRRWRNVWKNIPTLTFDDNFCKPLITSSKRTLIKVIYQVLLLHDGPILNFSLRLSDLASCAEIDQFLLVVSKRGIKNLTLGILKGESYRFPSSIFSCEQLEHLSLYTCSFRPPAGFIAFSKLVSLKLVKVSTDARLFSSLIRNCPLLEILIFQSKNIYDRLEFFAPNLKALQFMGVCKFLCFSNTPKLASVGLYWDGRVTNAPKKCSLYGRLPKVEYLDLTNYFAEYMTVNHALVACLHNLKSLRLWYMCFRTSGHVSSVISLIRNSPKLEKLGIWAHMDYSKPDSIIIKGWDVALHHLREVKLLKLSGLKSELQFIKLLLANSPAMKTIVLEPKQEKVEIFFKQVLNFRRASPIVNFCYQV